MLKDQFCDYEDINVLTPVRQQGMILIQKICELSQIYQKDSQIRKDVQLLIQNLPQLLVVCEHDWQAKMSFFMIMKGIIQEKSQILKKQMFQMFGKGMLIQSIQRVEDSVKIVVTEIISLLIDMYFDSDNSNGHHTYNLIDLILENLSQTLKLTDDIEGSVIYVFNLINLILNHQQFDPLKSKFKIQSQVFFPFNFHRVIKVRRTFNKLIGKFLKIRNFFDQDQLFTLHTLTVQSIIMEQDDDLQNILQDNLHLIVLQLCQNEMELKNMDFQQCKININIDMQMQSNFVSYLSSYLFMPQRFQNWLYSSHMQQTSFKHFLFIESPCFESLNNNYYTIIYEPVSKQEKNAQYIHKLQKCIQILAIIAGFSNLQQYISQFLKMNTVPNLVSQNSLIEYMFYEKIFKVNQNDCTTELIKSLNANCLEQMSNGFNIQNTNLYDYKDLLKFEDDLGSLSIRFRKRGQLDFANIFIQVADCLLKRKQQIDSLLQGNQITNNISNIDFASLDQLLNQSIDFCQSLTSGTIKSQVQDLNQQFSSLILNQQLICDRYRAFVVCQHLVAFNCSEGPKRQLFQKLNDIIHPIWNQLKEEQEVFFQKIFARIIVQDLLAALTNAGKLKQAEAVQSLILAGLGKLSKTKNYSGLHLFIEEETGDDQKNEFEFLNQEQIQYNTEVRGCEFIVQEWIKENNYGILNIQKIQKLISQFDPNDSEDKFQVFVSVLFKIIQNLFLNRAQSKSRQKNEKNDIIQNLNLILNSIQSRIYFFKINSIKFVPDLIVNLFYLLSLEIKTQCDSEKDNYFKIQIDLVSIIVSNLEGQSLGAFKILQYLLEQCLSQKQRQIANEDKHTDEMILQKNMGELSQDILKYLALFLIPVIRNLQYSKTIFNGEEKQGMKILSLLIQLLPLCSMNQNPNDLLASKVGLKLKEGKEFLNVFTQINIESSDFQIHVLPNSELRNYQKQGIIWMSKLGRMGLNCALCDDMGLGKTIQSLTVVLSESYLFRNDDKNNRRRALNLVICPNTLTYQWYKEVDKFFGQYQINCAILDTSSSQVQSIVKRIQQNDIDILITSYEKARNDFAMLQQFKFFYIVLDEGHRIKNAKSKTALCIKTLQAERKLVLTGTPLQNKVSELWSIFDFLMPNFLEVEKVFNQKYNQFLSSNLNKLSEKLEDTQSFIQALKSLKKRITPFILRRTKQEVLKDLPPKQIQDFDCQMTPTQQKIHNYIEQNYPIQQVTQGTNLEDLQNQNEEGTQQEEATKSMKGSQILQNLILHRKVCNHPSLVIDQIPNDLKNTLKYDQNQFSNDSGKMLGLIDLLKECQIISTDLFDNDDKSEEAPKEKGSRQKKNGNIVEDQAKFQGFLHLADDNDSDDMEQLKRPTSTSIEQIEGHRAIIFCQMQSYLQIVIDHILTPFGIKFAQMQASLTGQQRFELVEKFNNDTTISVIIMTTSVGGLGLNLTGADTVIFMEHDWNPMKDLQAIDRAHRIGQKRRVNVYRLILRDTLEQKIMSLQSFKKNLAKNLIQSRRADFSIQDAENLQMHDLLSCFEEHTVYNETTANQIELANKKKDPNVIGAESYQDKVGKDDGLEPDFE